jgi:hypothetical protein
VSLTVRVVPPEVARHPAEIRGHPEILLPNASDNPVAITVCCECGAMRSVLWLDNDRWRCNSCRAESGNRPTVIPIA